MQRMQLNALPSVVEDVCGLSFTVQVLVYRVHCVHCRQKTEALLRYHLYVDCMPVEGMGELGKEELERMLTTARSSPRLKEER